MVHTSVPAQPALSPIDVVEQRARDIRVNRLAAVGGDPDSFADGAAFGRASLARQLRQLLRIYSIAPDAEVLVGALDELCTAFEQVETDR